MREPSSSNGAPHRGNAALVPLSTDHPPQALRLPRATAAAQAQRSHELLLLDPPAESLRHVDLHERHAVALFTALLHRSEVAAQLHRQSLLAHGAPHGADLADAITALAARALQLQPRGPWGFYPKGPPRSEAQVSAALQLTDAEAQLLGPRLAAALVHAYLLVQHPRDAAPRALQRLVDAGWSSTGIVTLSQLVAFLAFHLRVVHGLRVVAGRPGTS